MFRAREQVQQRLIAAKLSPLPDITAYELAIIFVNLPYGGRSGAFVNFTPGEWDALAPGVRRHFEQI